MTALVVMILIFLFVLVVSKNDLLHELMTDDVTIRELMDRNTLDSVKYLHSRPKSADLTAGEVGLRKVTRDDCL